MVGVPRSRSCRECLQRRVKCDRLHPECRRCQARGMRCPGYRRALKFYNQTTDNDFKDAKEYEQLQAKPDACSSSTSTSTLIRRPSTSIDESLAPNLAGRALDSQTKEVFEYVVFTTFPLTFCTFAPRLEPNWVDFIRHHQAAQTKPIQKAIRVLNAWYLGVKNKDQEIINQGRYIYGDALRSLAGLVANPKTRTADITLATAVMLSVFEMLDPVTPHSWLVHSSGIASLIRERGPRVHNSGFGRTMFVTIRSFLVADAFVRQEVSYLEEPEWRAANEEATVLEDRAGKGSWMGRFIEQIFNQISLGPGFLAQTTALITNGETDADAGAGAGARENLIARIQQSRSILRNLQRQLTSVSGLEAKLKEMEKLNPKGPFSIDDVRAVASRCLQGLCAGLALLDQLLVLLNADCKTKQARAHGRISNSSLGLDSQTQVQTPGPSSSSWAGQIPVPTATHEGPFSGEDRPLDWLDQISMSMGTLAISNT
ncbi:hypothetical protein BJX70DRAFT_218603 [Aspergillus crustosus]